MHFFRFILPFILLSLDGIAGMAIKTNNPDTLIRGGDVVINEIMADPDPAAGTIVYSEYIELFNKKAFPIRLKNWKLVVGTSYKSLPDVIIPADSFLVLTSPSVISVFPAGLNVAGIAGFPALTNTGQTIQLLNNTGNMIAVVMYTDDWYQDELKKEGGYSLEQLDPDNACGGMDNWRASMDKSGGTPGKRNSVVTVNTDKQPPEIEHIGIRSSTQLEIYFKEPMDSTTLLDPGSYQITSIGNPISVKPIKPLYDRVLLILGMALQEKTMYTVTVNTRPCDCAGNTLGGNYSIRVAIPEDVKPSDVAINEVLFDPNQNGVDFVEIFNRSDKTIDLKTIFLCHYDSIHHLTSSVEHIIDNSYLLFPGEYRVLTESASVVKQQYIARDPYAFIEVRHLPSLNVDKGDIALKTANELIDFFMYNKDMHFVLLHETKGISLERVSPWKSTNDRANWHSAASTVGFATPGFKNSQYVETIEDNKTVTVLPEIFTPDNDGVNDLVNLYYKVEEPGWSATVGVYDQIGRPVKTLANNELIGTEGSYSWDGTDEVGKKEPIGIYVLYIQFLNVSGKIKGYKKVCVLSGKN